MNGVEPGLLVLALSVLAHALASRLPATRTNVVLANVVWGFALALVLVLLLLWLLR